MDPDPVSPGRLRSAADHIDDARTDLDYGDIDIEDGEKAEMVEETDEILAHLESQLRTISMLVEEDIATANDND